MAQVFRMHGQLYSAGQQAQMYFARKRRRQRAEASSGTHGGLRVLRDSLGIKMAVTLTAA